MSGFNEQTVPVSLSRQQWEHVLTMLAHRPFNESAQLIMEVQRQCQMHEMRQHARPSPQLVPEDFGPIPKVVE